VAPGLPEEAQQVLSDLFIEVDAIFQRLAILASRQLEARDRNSVVVQLVVDPNVSPQTTGFPPENFRIAVPISLIHKLWSISRAIDPGHGAQEDWRDRCVVLSALLAFAHELNHAFSGHLTLATGVAEEANSDFRAGGLLAGWLVRPDLRRLLRIDQFHSERVSEFVAVAAALLVIAVWPASPRQSQATGYLPPARRFQVFLAGNLFYLQSVGEAKAFEAVLLRIEAFLRKTFSHEAVASYISALIEGQDDVDLKKVATDIDSRRATWYANATLLRPIRGALYAALKRVGLTRRSNGRDLGG
jgi:hypothetical protein